MFRFFVRIVNRPRQSGQTTIFNKTVMKKIITLLLAASFSISIASAQSAADVRKKQYNLDDNGLALKGTTL